MTKVKNTIEFNMTREHLNQSLQQYLRQYSYLKEDDEFLEIDSLVISGDHVKMVGRVVENV